MLDGVEDVEVGEGADDTEEDNGFDGCVSRMQREWPQEDSDAAEHGDNSGMCALLSDSKLNLKCAIEENGVV
jgi:hypothetical protein